MMAQRAAKFAARLRDCTSGAIIIEFAMLLPVIALMGLGGIEVANFALVNMRVNQIAVSLADNASRAKQATIGAAPRMREFDVNQAFSAAVLQADGLDLATNGRLILSSLQVNGSGGQWIQWQRCSGALSATSSYGTQGIGATGTAFAGMGPSTRLVTAESNAAVMFAEVVYQYRPVYFSGVVATQQIRKFAAMYVRDDRDLTQIYNPSPTSTVSSC